MVAIKAFGGLVPRLAHHQLPENGATIAHDVKLRNGKLQAWRERQPLQEAVDGALSFFPTGCCYPSWDACVQATEYLPDDLRVFIAGRTAYPESMVFNGCVPAYLRLGVPAPNTAPTISGTQVFGETSAERSYVYTYENVYMEESAPSPASPSITVRDGGVVTVSGMETPPAGYGITQINIYRSATGSRTGSEADQEPLTDFFYVGSIASGNFQDNLFETALGDAISTREVRVPPVNMWQISHVKGTGTLAGVTTNHVHFSEDYEPWNWPAAYDMVLPHNIVNMVTVDNWVFVSTDARPYVLDGRHQTAPRACRPVGDVNTPLPDISCGHAHGAVATPFGMIYSSTDGLVLVKPDATFDIITSGWISTDDWITYRPETVRLAYWRGFLICATDNITFMLGIDGKTYDDYQLGSMTTLSDFPDDMLVSDGGVLYMLEDNVIYQWDAGTTLRSYMWESRPFNFGGKCSPNTARLETDHAEFRLLTPHDGLYYERTVVDSEPFRVGRLGRHRLYRMGIYGTGTVEHAEVGTNMRTIDAGA